ncbi:class I SAM-dependent methyltransferase [Nesterenkonia alba]|uniref:class I SAM-dependent methyltransferase n=1 Tax=Nesterenkonia alba TaxID=515814 RepID=UPI00146CC096|nr:class I SAM-dependent methyltransferase [Nesterenkonia alba]
MHQISGPWTEDPEFVALYDVENTGLWDTEFYRDLAEELGVRRVADIGCGTGVLAMELASRGIEVIGVDPAAAMIEAAHRRGAQWTEQSGAAQRTGQLARVEFIHGTAERLPTQWAQLAVMVGHVAQYFLSRCAWDEVLAHAHRALVPGGWLAFESRNPATEDWEAWTPENTQERQPHPDGGEFTSWLEVLGVEHDDADGPLVTARGHHVFADGRHVAAEEPLRYRPLHVLVESLQRAGFTVEQTWGDWDRSPVEEDSPEFILLARSAQHPHTTEAEPAGVAWPAHHPK